MTQYLAIFDPADQWPDFEKNLPDYNLPFDEHKRVSITNAEWLHAIRVRAGDLENCCLMIALCPEGGFERDHMQFMKNCMASPDGPKLVFPVVLADDEELCYGEHMRSEPGYRTHFIELRRELGIPALVIPRKQIPDLVKRFTHSIEEAWIHSHTLKTQEKALDSIALITQDHVLSSHESAITELESVFTRLLRSWRAKALLNFALQTRMKLRESDRALALAVGEWEAFTTDAQDICASAARNVPYFSVAAEKIFSDEDQISKILTILQKKWNSTPTRALSDWHDEAIGILQTSELVLPIVGVFSSGKTTLINMILGKTKKSRELLRTSITHNTALLCSFHSIEEGESNRAEFTWRKKLPSMHLVANTLSSDDLRRINPIGLLRLSPRAIRSCDYFIRSGLLTKVSAEVKWRKVQEVESGEVEISPPKTLTHRKDLDHLFDILFQLIGTSDAEMHSVNIGQISLKHFPIEVSLTGDVSNDNGRTETHLLETDEDWDWFQGKADDKLGSADSITGFAESPEAEYLVSQCDVYLNNPLFRQVNLVDTPGLNSITEHHDQITEVFTREGHCFLFMAKLAKASGHKDSGRMLEIIRDTIYSSNVKGNAAERVFLVLNWFREQAGARTEKDAKERIREFVKLAGGYLDSRKLRLYVVDLSPSMLQKGDWPKRLLGRPSLGQLLIDLKSYIAEKGTTDRFTILHDRLERIWTDWKKSLNRKRQVLEGERNPATDKEHLIVAKHNFGEKGKYRRELEDHLESEIQELLKMFKTLSRRLHNLEKKDEFEDFVETGSAHMQRFNEYRIKLGDELSSELCARLNSSLHGILDGRFVISAPKAALNNVKPMATATFRKQLRSAMDRWPSFCFLYSPAKARKKEFEDKFFSDEIRGQLEGSLSVLKKAYAKEVSRVLREVHRALDQRLGEVEFALKKRKDALDELSVQESKLELFAPMVKEMLKALAR